MGHIVTIDSTLTDAQIEVSLQTAPTATELQSVQDYLNSRQSATDIPNWATWSVSDWETWRVDHLSDAQVDLIANLAQAKLMLKQQNAVIDKLAQLEIALRDRVFPHLGNGA